MRASGMLRQPSTTAGHRRAPLFILAPLLLLLSFLVAHASALPLQYLPEIPGYIPVYIRHGDQPLEEINPALAEAFHESTGILKNIQEIRLDMPSFEIPNKDLTDRNDISLDSKEDSIVPVNIKPPVVSKQLIFVLPQENNLPQKPKASDKESVVMKLNKPSFLEKIEVKKLTKETKQKEKNK